MGIMVWHKGMSRRSDIGLRKTYADIAATCAEWLGLPDRFGAESFAKELL